MKIKPSCAVILSAASLCLVACDRDTRRSEPDTVTGTPTERTQSQLQPVSGSTPRAVQAITQARCAREQHCGNVGADKRYSSERDCMVRIQSDWQSDLNARECPGGVNQTQLADCLDEIRNDDCNNPMDTMGRFVACRESALCQSAP